ncbi:kelch-like protein 17 [Oscarella lobularis]|uniref:kelch-like protein 17 n=1 Tax=Oscarella lobularis TaxID=121494 RepID=UPI003313BE23
MVETVVFETDDYSALDSLDSFRLSSYLCDVVLVSKDGQRFPAHQMTLAAATPFFPSLFTENRLETFRTQAVISIPDVDAEILKKLIEFAYSGKAACLASVQSVRSLYVVASSLQFNHLVQLCRDWLRLHVDSSTCLDLAILANQYDDIDLIRVCDRIAAVNVVRLSDSEKFLALSVDHLERILCQDDLGVRSEDDVLSLLRTWLKRDEASRRDDVVKRLSKCIRYSLLDFDESIGLLSNLDLVSHYESSSLTTSFSYRRRVGCEGVLLVAGGIQTKREDSDVWTLTCEAKTYDANSDSWTSFPSLATATCRNKIVTSFDELYALGGDSVCEAGGKTYGETDVVQRYDAEGRRWVDDVTPMSRRRDGYEIVCHDNRIYGMSLAWDFGVECEVFDPARGTWTPVSSPSRDQAFDFFSSRYILFSQARHIFAIGHAWRREIGCMQYDPLENRWLDKKSFPGAYEKTNSAWNTHQVLDPFFCHYASMGERLYILPHYESSTAVVFDLNERFSLVENFSPLRSYAGDFFERNCGLAGDPDNNRMYLMGSKEREKQLAVYDERSKKWDVRKCEWNFPNKRDCAVVDRNLMLNFV